MPAFVCSVDAATDTADGPLGSVGVVAPLSTRSPARSCPIAVRRSSGRCRCRSRRGRRRVPGRWSRTRSGRPAASRAAPRAPLPAMVPCSAAVRGMVTLPPVGLIDGPLRQGGAVEIPAPRRQSRRRPDPAGLRSSQSRRPRRRAQQPPAGLPPRSRNSWTPTRELTALYGLAGGRDVHSLPPRDVRRGDMWRSFAGRFLAVVATQGSLIVFREAYRSRVSAVAYPPRSGKKSGSPGHECG